jgi:hypothetical protein
MCYEHTLGSLILETRQRMQRQVNLICDSYLVFQSSRKTVGTRYLCYFVQNDSNDESKASTPLRHGIEFLKCGSTTIDGFTANKNSRRIDRKGM